MLTMADIEALMHRIEVMVWPIWVGFTLLILGALFFFSRAEGWHELHKYYPVRDPYQGRWLGKDLDDMHVQFNHSETVNAINVGADSQGMYLSVSMVFRPFHPPLFIPWSDVAGVGVKEVPWLKKDNLVKFTFAMNPNIPVYLDPSFAEEIENLSQGQWRMPALH